MNQVIVYQRPELEDREKKQWSREEIAQILNQFENFSAQYVSQRVFAQTNDIPRSTLQYWIERKHALEESSAVAHFFESPDGLAFLHRLVIAAQFTINEIVGGGIRPLCLFLELSGLDRFVASSYGSQQIAVSAMEQTMVQFAQEEKAKLAKEMSPKKITVCQDETFHPETCLVAIEPVSNFIVLEKYADKRDEQSWSQAMKEAVKELPVEVIQSTSDEAKGLLKHVKEGLEAHHSPDLFHVQYELGKGTSAALNARERHAKEEHEKTVEQVKIAIEEKLAYQARIEERGPGRPPDFEKRIESAKEQEKEAKEQLEVASKRREIAQETKRDLSRIYHPYDLETGEIRQASKVAQELEQSFEKIEKVAKQASLSQGSKKRIEKAKRVVSQLIATIVFIHGLIRAKVEGLGVSEELEKLLYECWIPGLYIEQVAAKSPGAQERETLSLTATKLLEPISIRAGPLGELGEEEWKVIAGVAKECAELFQRSSSCVEGRNGYLELRHHSLHRIGGGKLKALTVIHNYFIIRADGSTAAERFFGGKPRDLFKYLLDNLEVPRRPAEARSGSVAVMH